MTDFSSLAPYLNRLDAVFSDVDGTMVHNEGRALDRIGEEIGKFLNKDLGNIRHMAGTPISSIREIFSHRHNVEVPKSVEDKIMKRRAAEPEFGEKVLEISDVVDALRFFQSQQKPVMAVTSSERHRAEGYLKAAGLEITSPKGLFSLPHTLVSGHSDFETIRHKPHPDCYNRALELCVAHPARTLTFEDSPGGVQAGVAADIPTIGVLLGDHIVESRREALVEEMIAHGCTAIVAKPEDLIPALVKVLNAMPDRFVVPSADRPDRKPLRLVAGRDHS